VDVTRNSFRSGLWGALQNNILNTYLRGGGSLWIFGVGAVRGSAQVPGQYKYGTAPDASSFAAVFLKISGIFNMVPFLTHSNRADGFRDAVPNRALGDKIPVLDSLDYSRGGISATYGMTRVETIMSAMQDPDLSQRPDTVYFYKANYPSSGYNMKACAVSYFDVFNGSKVPYMGFPIHHFFESKADSLVCYVIDWVFGGLPSPR